MYIDIEKEVFCDFCGCGEEVGLEMRGGVCLEVGKRVYKKNRKCLELWGGVG